ncbi:MAG: SDR family oxidoreductase [Burkholderiales bacterium]|jgi:NAD(P)-dependent dehydrogenase (short-subunit alcohol dehydrogenase family)
MPTALVLGASRGLGLEFTRQYLAEGWTVYATHRSEADRIKLRDLGAHTLKLDVMQVADVAGIAWQLDGERLDVAVMNAGVYGPRTSSPRQPPGDADFDTVMRTNVLAAMRIVPVVAPLLAPARGTLAFVSSRMGSIAEAGAAYGMLYRVSKAAVNMVAKLAHVEHAPLGVRVLSLHPGWVRTDMGGPNADVAVTESIAGLRRVIADTGAFPGGCFYDYRGQSLAW